MYPRLTGPWASEESPVSESFLTLEVLDHSCITTSDFVWFWGFELVFLNNFVSLARKNYFVLLTQPKHQIVG